MRIPVSIILAAAALAGCDSASPPADTQARAPADPGAATVGAAVSCAPAEIQIYACDFGGAAVTVCADPAANTVAYRSGPAGAPDLTLLRMPGERGLVQDVTVGGGGGSQHSITFTEGDLAYIAYSAEQGNLTDDPGARYSGVVVYRGGAEVERHDCPQGDQAVDSFAIPEAVPFQPDPDKSMWY